MDEYIRTHNELFELFSKAYANVFILNEIEHHNAIISNENKALVQASSDVVGYFVELVKADLALTLYKIGIDKDQKGTMNNLYRLREKAKIAFPDIEIPYISISKDLGKVEEVVRNMRNSFLAHDDAKREHLSIQIADMERLLDRYNELFAQLTYKNKTEEIHELTKSSIEGIHMKMSMGLGFILQKAYFDLSE